MSRRGDEMGRPPAGDLALLALAVAAVSTSAPLVRAAHAPALAVAFWRTGLAAGVVVPVAALRRGLRPWRLPGRELRLAVGAGALLAAHFATWIPSLSFTSVASSVALVATQPVWAALLARARGATVATATWVGIGVALAGTVAVTGVDISVSGRALAGDVLALTGGVLAAAYVTVGAEVRRTIPTTAYTAVCYPTAAVLLLVSCRAGRQPLVGWSAGTWVCLVAITVGPQLLGHSVLNRVLGSISPTLVSAAILLEIVGATALARIFFSETPPAGALPGAALIAAGVVLVVRSGRPAPAEALVAD